MSIELEILELITYNSEKHSDLKEEFSIGIFSSKYIQKIGERLDVVLVT